LNQLEPTYKRPLVLTSD